MSLPSNYLEVMHSANMLFSFNVITCWSSRSSTDAFVSCAQPRHLEPGLTLLLSVPLELRITFLIYSMFKPNTGKSGLQFCLMMISKTLKSLDCFRVTLAVVIEKDALFAGIEIATRKRSKGES